MTTDTDTAPSTANVRAPYSWVAPLISTVVTVPGGLLAFFFAGLSAMICDPCNGAQASQFDRTFGIAFSVFSLVLLVALGLLITSWVQLSLGSNAARSIGFAAAAPACVLVGSLVFFGVVSAAGPG